MPRIRTGDVKVDGLRELNAALKAIGPDARAELKDASLRVANLVADDARSAAYSLGGLPAKAAPSIKAAGSATGAAGVALGGAAYPFAGVAEFGASPRKRTGWYANNGGETPQFAPWRGNDSGAGYFLYPAIRQDADRIVTEYTSALDDIIKRRFPQ